MLPCLAVIIINDICTVIFDRSFCIEHIPWDVKYIYQLQDKRTFDYLQICNSNQNNNYIILRVYWFKLFIILVEILVFSDINIYIFTELTA